MRVRRLRVDRPADLTSLFERYRLPGPLPAAAAALDLHVLFRSPTATESACLTQLASGMVEIHASRAIACAEGALAAGVPAAAAPALLLSGEPSGFRALLARLGSAPPPGRELADALGRALDPPRPTAWRLRTRELALDRPLLMGIVNVTPDSFSDGGWFLDPAAATDRGAELVRAGADLLDVGGESTRPGATRVGAEEEWRRVLPVVEALVGLGVPVSIDTTRAGVARDALAAGAEVVNDVSALGFDPEMPGVVADGGAGVVLMHMQGTPQTMQAGPSYQDVAGEVLESLGGALARALAAGVDAERCAVDPGIGFGKRRRDNEELLYRLAELRPLGRPVLVGPSRKSFLDPDRLRAPSERLPETIAAACLAAVGGAHILRVHDVEECGRALRVVERVLADASAPPEPAQSVVPPERA